MIARRLIVRGRVQGVFFRDWTVATAMRLGVSGWVRNRPDGTVEIMAEGAAEAVGAFVDACHRGPERARVDAVTARDSAPTAATTFERRPTG